VLSAPLVSSLQFAFALSRIPSSGTFATQLSGTTLPIVNLADNPHFRCATGEVVASVYSMYSTNLSSRKYSRSLSCSACDLARYLMPQLLCFMQEIHIHDSFVLQRHRIRDSSGFSFAFRNFSFSPPQNTTLICPTNQVLTGFSLSHTNTSITCCTLTAVVPQVSAIDSLVLPAALPGSLLLQISNYFSNITSISVGNVTCLPTVKSVGIEIDLPLLFVGVHSLDVSNYGSRASLTLTYSMRSPLAIASYSTRLSQSMRVWHRFMQFIAEPSVRNAEHCSELRL
jgi:hypothetical protein